MFMGTHCFPLRGQTAFPSGALAPLPPLPRCPRCSDWLSTPRSMFSPRRAAVSDMTQITIIGAQPPLTKIGEHSFRLFKSGVQLGSEENLLTRDHLLKTPTETL